MVQNFCVMSQKARLAARGIEGSRQTGFELRSGQASVPRIRLTCNQMNRSPAGSLKIRHRLAAELILHRASWPT